MPKVIMMKKTLFYFLTIISLASVSNAFGQGRPDYFGIANRAFDNGNYQQASNYYQKLLKEEPDSTISLYPFGMNYRGFGFVTLTEINQISYKLAECYRNLHDYKNAEVWAAKARALNDKDFPLAQFYYAEALQRNGKYLLAIEEYRQFNSQITEFSPRYYDALLGVESSTYAIAQIKNPDSTYIGKLSDEINGQGSVFAASLDESKTELIYTSSAFILTEIEDEEAPKPKKNQEIEKEEVYSTKLFSTMKIGANYTAPSPIDIEVKEGYGIAEASFNRKMTRVYFTMWKGNPTKGDYSIYVANKKDNIWGKPEKLGKNVNAVNSRALMPYYYETENILFFVSDRKGGAGGLDIWYAQVDTFGRPNTPLNLGKEINTAKDDVTPFYDIITGALFFSSNGRVGMGGMDIFKAEGFLDNWKAVNNLGYPINSSKEDLYYAAGADYQSGYFTSDRMDCKDCAGPACLKLYEIKVPPLRYKTTALDAETMEPIEGVVIELMDSSAKFKYQETLSNEKGSVIIEMEPASDYTIKASKKGCLTESLKYSTVNKPIKWYHGRF
ncbi:MAG: OOP family OmpA-OmpF porin [Sphingobacteriales bacterium]|jgi:OOP family OmpA-OmpF porin